MGACSERSARSDDQKAFSSTGQPQGGQRRRRSCQPAREQAERRPSKAPAWRGFQPRHAEQLFGERRNIGPNRENDTNGSSTVAEYLQPYEANAHSSQPAEHTNQQHSSIWYATATDGGRQNPHRTSRCLYCHQRRSTYARRHQPEQQQCKHDLTKEKAQEQNQINKAQAHQKRSWPRPCRPLPPDLLSRGHRPNPDHRAGKGSGTRWTTANP